MDDLRILIARLGWPTPSCRWWTLQELAKRLSDPATTAETEAALLKLLHSRKLEAEVVEAFCIFWMAAVEHAYVPNPDLPNRTPKPSLLSNLFLEALGFEAQALDADLKAAPNDFEIPDDFDGVQGVDLARIFRTTLSRLELRTNLPLIRQMAFEWAQNRTTYPEAPLQGDIWHLRGRSAKVSWVLLRSRRPSCDLGLLAHLGCSGTAVETAVSCRAPIRAQGVAQSSNAGRAEAVTSGMGAGAGGLQRGRERDRGNPARCRRSRRCRATRR